MRSFKVEVTVGADGRILHLDYESGEVRPRKHCFTWKIKKKGTVSQNCPSSLHRAMLPLLFQSASLSPPLPTPPLLPSGPEDSLEVPERTTLSHIFKPLHAGASSSHVRPSPAFTLSSSGTLQRVVCLVISRAIA